VTLSMTTTGNSQITNYSSCCVSLIELIEPSRPTRTNILILSISKCRSAFLTHETVNMARWIRNTQKSRFSRKNTR
jgi:hypothetical protein